MNSSMPPVGGNDLSLQNESNAAHNDAANSVGSIAVDVEEFAKTWVHRANRLVHRAARLVERETLLAGAIGRLNQQKEEWTRRTEAKDTELREQSELLTEAWLEVEAERRKAIQGARVAQNTTKRSNMGPVMAPQSNVSPVIPTPIQAVPGPAPAGSPSQPPSPIHSIAANSAPANSAPANSAPANSAPANSGSGTVQPTNSNPSNAFGQTSTACNSGPVPIQNVQPILNQAPAGMAPPMQPPVPTSGAPDAPRVDELNDPDVLAAATKERLEEFKRMQRAIRANRNT